MYKTTGRKTHKTRVEECVIQEQSAVKHTEQRGKVTVHASMRVTVELKCIKKTFLTPLVRKLQIESKSS